MNVPQRLFNNNINTNPPNTARGTVRIIINGCTNELNVAAITRYAVKSANAKIIYNSACFTYWTHSSLVISLKSFDWSTNTLFDLSISLSKNLSKKN